MPAPPLRTGVSGTPSRATANTAFGALYDYVTGLLGATGNAPEARTLLGVPASADVPTLAGSNTFAAANTFTAGISGVRFGMRNLIINGHGQINQRGYVSGTAVGAANTYTLDRWRVVTSGQALTFSASGNGNLMTAPAGGVEQVIEGASIFGGTYVINWIGTATCTVGGVSRAKGASFTLTGGSNVTVRFSGGTYDEVQIEPGAVASPFEHRNFGVELALCQRYARPSEIALGVAINTTLADFVFEHPVPMRAPPTLTQISSGISFRVAGSTATIGVTAAAGVTGAESSVVFITRTSGSWAAGNAVLILEPGALFFGSEL